MVVVGGRIAAPPHWLWSVVVVVSLLHRIAWSWSVVVSLLHRTVWSWSVVVSLVHRAAWSVVVVVSLLHRTAWSVVVSLLHRPAWSWSYRCSTALRGRGRWSYRCSTALRGRWSYRWSTALRGRWSWSYRCSTALRGRWSYRCSTALCGRGRIAAPPHCVVGGRIAAPPRCVVGGRGRIAAPPLSLIHPTGAQCSEQQSEGEVRSRSQEGNQETTGELRNAAIRWSTLVAFAVGAGVYQLIVLLSMIRAAGSLTQSLLISICIDSDSCLDGHSDKVPHCTPSYWNNLCHFCV